MLRPNSLRFGIIKTMEDSFAPNGSNVAPKQEHGQKPTLPAASILYAIRLVLVALATPLVALEPHTFQGYGHQAVDYTLLFIPFCLSVAMVVLAFKRKRLFPCFVYILCGYNLTLFALTFTPYFIEENHILAFLLAIDIAMAIYLRRSSRAAIYYGFGGNRAQKTGGRPQ